jgi:hypothetical protein
MANDWDYVSGGATIDAENLLQAGMKSIILASSLETESNRESTAKTDYFTYQITGDEEKVFAGSCKIPARLVLDVPTGITKLVPKNVFADVLTTYDPGTGTLLGTTNLPEAIVKIAELSTYWERQVRSTIVTKTPNQFVVAPDYEASVINLTFNVPVNIIIDILTGKVELKEDDYFYILGVQNP